MGPKPRAKKARKEVAGTHVEEVNEAERFVCEEAKVLCESYKRRKPHPERGIENHPPFDEYICFAGWEKFTSSMRHYNSSVVCEFYANLERQDNKNEVMCRGKSIILSDEAINDFYGLPNIERVDDELTKVYSSHSKEYWYDVVQTITRENVNVDEIVESDFNFIEKRLLSPEMNGWYHFIASRLCPVSINTEVHKARLNFLYAIKKKLRFNVGNRIRYFLLQGFGRSGCYGFSGLISGLCAKAGVQFERGDIIGSAMGQIYVEAFCKPVVIPKMTLESRITKLEASIEKLVAEKGYYHDWCDHLAKVLSHQFPEAVQAIGQFPPLQGLDNDCDAGPSKHDDVQANASNN